jgi:hypothetical protein
MHQNDKDTQVSTEVESTTQIESTCPLTFI